MAATKEGRERAEGPLTFQEMAQRSGFSNDKARTVLGWRPRPVETTITDTADSLIKLGVATT
jgi:hypothetical protein